MGKIARLVLRAGIRVFFSTGWIFKYGRNPEKYPLKERYAKAHQLLKFICEKTPVHFFVQGQENIPTDSNCVFTPNHQSNYDPICLVALSDAPLSFIAKKETLKFPYVGKVVKGIDGIFLDRKDIRQEIESINDLSMKLASEPSLSFAIFPEGTRSRDIHHQLGAFKPGALKAAYNASKPIVPVAIYGTFRCLDKKCKMKAYPVQISFLKPHLPEEFQNTSTVDMAKIIEEEVKKEVERLREEDKKLCQLDKNPKYQNMEFDVKGL